MDRELTLVGHLAELRWRIIISLICLALASAVSFSFVSPLLSILKLPASGLIEKLVFFSPQEALTINLRIAFLSGLIISMPVILHQIWVFISPALEEKFKKYITSFIFFSSLAFIAGCVFSYFVIIPRVLKFLMSFSKQELVPLISAEKYISFVTCLIMGTGIVFQMPVLSFLLTKLGIINAAFLRRKYRYALIAIFLVAAIITPTPDAFNMLILAGPMLLLYETSIWVSFFAQMKPRLTERSERKPVG
jgi:sec-independent protein translocase protein TatC